MKFSHYTKVETLRNSCTLYPGSSILGILPHLFQVSFPSPLFVLEQYFKADLRYQAISSLNTSFATSFRIWFLIGQAGLLAGGLLCCLPWHCASPSPILGVPILGQLPGWSWRLRNWPQAVGTHKDLEPCFSYFMHQKSLEGLLEHRALDSISGVSNSVYLSRGPQICILNKFPGVLMLQISKAYSRTTGLET